MTISARLAKIYASAPLDDEAYETMELRHPRFSRVWYITSNPVIFQATLEDGTTRVDFDPIPFTVKLPGNEHGGRQDLQITISNVDRVFIDELELANAQPTARIDVVYRVFAKSDLTTPAATPVRLSITDVQATNATVDAIASRADLLNHPFPNLVYEPLFYPGLVR
jgi:hypothetical protein